MQNYTFKILMIFLLLTSGINKSQTLCLSTTASFTTNLSSMPNSWGSPLSKDVNNDGKPDLILNSYASGYFGVSIGNGDGTFGSITKYNVKGGITNCNCLTSLDCDDYNSDGKKDIVVCAFDTVYLYNGNGLGGFSLLNKIKLGNYIGFFFPIKLIIQDFNNNGIKDLFCGDANGKGFILNGTGAGIFNYGSVFNSTIANSYNWFSNDFNNDGNFDLACFSPTITSNCTSSIFYGNGNHTFQPQINYGFYMKNNNLGFNSASLCDINKDGKMDIGFPGAVLKNNTTSFNLIYNDTVTNIEKVAFGYFDCDSLMDYHALVRKTGYYESRFYYGNGNFNFPNNVAQEPLSPSTLDYTYSFDFNQDGKFDLAVTKQNEVYVVSNKPTCIQSTNSTNEICQNGSIVLTANTASSYTWQPIASNTNTYSPTVSGNYYCLSNYSGQVCSSNTISVIINPLPSLSVAATNSIICDGTSVSLNASGANTYTWTGGVTNGVAFTPSLTNTYTVYASDLKGCQNFTTETIIVNSTPTISVNSGSICSGNSFTIIPSGANTYTYSSGSSIVSPTTNSSYSVSGTGANGCVSNTNAISNVIVSSNPTVTAISTNSLICIGESTTLYASGANTYTWTNGVTNNIAFSPSVTATYTVTGADLNGCINSDIIQVQVNTCTSLIESLNNSSLVIYPNPTSGQLNISGLDINQKQITITNVIGANIRTIETKGNIAISVDVENLSPGVYFITTNNKYYKFIKE